MNTSPSPKFIKKAWQYHRSIKYTNFFGPIEESVSDGITELPYALSSSYLFLKLIKGSWPTRILASAFSAAITTLVASSATELACESIDDALWRYRSDLASNISFKHGDDTVHAIKNNLTAGYYEKKFADIKTKQEELLKYESTHKPFLEHKYSDAFINWDRKKYNLDSEQKSLVKEYERDKKIIGLHGLPDNLGNFKL